MAEAKTRIYEVKNKSGELVALVEAANATRVYAHMAKSHFDVKSASQKSLHEAGRMGVEIETAGVEPNPLPEIDLVG